MINNKVLLSVIVPFQDLGILKENLLSSFRRETTEIELILVHDSKSRLSEQEVYRLKKGIHNTHYVHGEFNSPGLARNKGLELASGDWIIFWDSDDFAYPTKVLDVLDSKREDVVVANFKSVNRSNSVRRAEVESQVEPKQIAINPGLWRFIFPSKIANSCRFRELKLGEDIIFLIECGAFDIGHVFVQDIIYEYRITPVQSTKNMDIELHLQKFIQELAKVIVSSNSKSKYPYAIFWRQVLSLLRYSKGRKLFFIFDTSFYIFRILESSRKVLFMRSILLSLGRGVV
jgi:glycosyltransferase involved in cell wall biosynthesis